jgi:voltage-gated potassium channel Kch
MPVPSPLNDLRVGLRWLRWRVLILAVVFGLALVALGTGVTFSERADLGPVPWGARIYYTLGLFFFGGLDLGVPLGGPAWGRVLLWISYFCAPAITTTAVVEGILLALQPQERRLRWLKNHVVVGGCGRLAMLYLQRLHETGKKRSVLIVDSRADHPLARSAVEVYRALFLTGDLSSRAVMESLNLRAAQSAVLLTGDDHVNLDAAARILQMAPQLSGHVLAHVSDLRLLRTIERNQLLPGVVKFNSYQTAARCLVQDRLLPHFVETEPHDVVVLAGFGRFGQTVLDELQIQAIGQFELVLIVDREASLCSQVFQEQVGFREGYRHDVLERDLRHPQTWEQVQERIGHAHCPVFVLGTGDDGLNVRTALWLTSRFPRAEVVARCFRTSSFTEQISSEHNFDVVSTSDLLLRNMPRL